MNLCSPVQEIQPGYKHWVMSLTKKILIAVLVILIVIQFIRPTRNTSSAVLPSDISNVLALPADVQPILKRACYDCHSNNTSYPWYMNIQPVAWYLAHHVDEGK